MKSDIAAYDEAIASLTAPGGGFELNSVMLGGVEYRNYAVMPGSLRDYYAVMLNHAQKVFAVYQHERYTFAEAHQHGAEIGAALVQRYDVAKGDRVAILSRNNPQWMMAFMGATSVGAVAVPMNGWWTTEELDYGFADSGAKVVVADRNRIERLMPLVKKHGLRVISIDRTGAAAGRLRAWRAGQRDSGAARAGHRLRTVFIDRAEHVRRARGLLGGGAQQRDPGSLAHV